MDDWPEWIGREARDSNVCDRSKIWRAGSSMEGREGSGEEVAGFDFLRLLRCANGDPWFDANMGFIKDESQ